MSPLLDDQDDMHGETPHNPPEREPVQTLPAPANSREMFQLLSSLESDDKLDELLARVDFSGVASADLHQLVLGTAPEHITGGTVETDPRVTLTRALRSWQFRARAVVAFLEAFPELARDIFIHVPKCAGTDLTTNLRERELALPASLGDPGFIGEADFLTTLGALARNSPHHSRIFVHGHVNLGEYSARSRIRPEDHVFTIIRDPVALMVSQANYAIGRLRQDPLGHEADTSETLQRLGMTRLPDGLPDGDLKDLTVRALLDQVISPPNQACRHLGPHPGSGFEDTIVHIIANNVEITTTQFYERWLMDRWDIPRSERHNQSDTILTPHEAGRLFPDHLHRATSEDQKLFDLVTWAIQQAGTASVTGRQIARLIAPRPVVAFARELTETLRTARANKATGVFLVEEPGNVSRYLQPPTIAPSLSPVVTEIISVRFGSVENGNGYLGPGWYGPEDKFVWSQGNESILWLPPGPRDGICVIRVVGTPFVVDQHLLSQEIKVAVNGRSIGSRVLRETSLLEFDIPRDMAEAGAPLEIVFTIAGARRASSVRDSVDHRTLGFCLERMSVVHIRRQDGT